MRWQLTRAIALIGIALLSTAASAPDLRLIDAARNGDSAAVRALLKQGVDPSVRQKDGSTALHWAAYRDDGEAVEALIRAGGDVKAANDLGATPIWAAALNGNATMVRRLLEAGADANAALTLGESVVMTAARGGSAESVELLLRKGADPNRRAARGQTALMWAVAQQHSKVVKVLLAHSADVEARTDVSTSRKKTDSEQSSHPDYQVTAKQGGETALMFAAQVGDLASARLLVDAGADINATSASGTSALVLAAHSDQAEVATLLLERGADANAAAAGYTALHAAILRRNLDVVTELLQHGADPNVPLRTATPTRRDADDFYFHNTFIGATPIWLAARFGQPEVMRLLAARGANPQFVLDVTYPEGSYGTYYYEHEGATSVLMAAVGMGGKGARGWAPLPRPARAVASLEAVKVARELGVDLNVANANGDTALHSAAAQELDQVVQYLVDAGANRELKNGKGMTALDNEWIEFSNGGRRRW